MASLVLSGDTSGSITVAAPAVAGSNTQTLVAATGTLAPLISGTAVAVSGTSVEFTSIPSWVKRITVMFLGVSTNSTNNWQIQVGTGGTYTTSGYVGAAANQAGTAVANSTGIVVNNGPLATDTMWGQATIVKTGANATQILATGTLGNSFAANLRYFGGAVTPANAIDCVRVIASATGSPSDTFDAGTINILYE